jgi:hypothetical protein
MPEQPTIVVPCPRCGQMGSGNFCNYCGANMHVAAEKDTNPFFAFASGFFNLKNIKRYLQLYFRMLAAPVGNTIKAHKVISFENALKFLQLSVAIYTLLTAGKILYAKVIENMTKEPLWNEVLTEVFYLIAIVCGYLILLKFFYMFASRRWGKKDKHDYVKMYCLFAGFVLPLQGIFFFLTDKFLTSENSREFTSTDIIKIFLSIGFSTAALLYASYIWQYFWNAPGNKVVSQLLWAALLSFIICYVPLVFLLIAFDIKL